MNTDKIKLENVVNYLNERFSQDSEEYSIFCGAKPQVIRYDNDTAVSIWACGAIVCIGTLVYFIQEDDGYWFAPEYNRKNCSYSEIGIQNTFSLGWGNSFIEAFQRLNDYVKENGTPYYYQLGTDENGNTIYSDTICGYELK